MKKFALIFIILAFAMCLSASAQKALSPAIDIIAKENEMIKTGLLSNGAIDFDTADFDVALGNNVSSITICSLPKESEGKLMLENLYVVENQVIYREDFSLLKFVSASSEEAVSAFSFIPNDCAYEISCSLKTTKSINFSPVAANGESISAWTQENISNYGVLTGYDPDGDALKYEIVNYPKKGLIKITDNLNGDYKYTPYLDATGVDAFSYRVRDSYGNYSEICTVSVRIDKLRVNLVFNDIEEKYLNAALIVSEFEIMECVKNEDGTISFNPNQSVTKEEFLYLLMTVMGAKDVPTLEKTRFADDNEISKEYKGYAESAFSLGIIKGESKVDGVYFNPKKEITVAEAAEMINKIIGAKTNNFKPTFNDEKDVPMWAKDALTALNGLGIIETENGSVYPNKPLTRAQTAQILMSLLQFRQKIN